ncbi:hypothetical protein [Agrococcus sp. KRD186]|uniref:hypothetical protein n=1 Tax=Agrococcus sp. KRD186 TaxID=2729730 RepID=UPI0019CF4C5B|nr:hypothetical protein [Agrococcus sp. KRD186]
MDVEFAADALAVEEQFYAASGPEYERLWEVLDRILEDADEAKHANWSNFVSSLDLWGSKVPGTQYMVFWRTSPGPVLYVAVIALDQGI